jgi:hypothetical protein
VTAAMIPSASSSGSLRKCDACQAPTEFDPAAGALRCPYCAAERAIPRDPGVPLHPLSAARTLSQRVPVEGVRGVVCRHCGATASPLAAAERIESLAPAEGIVPFAITKAKAKELFSQWIAGLWFRPSDLRRYARLTALRGVYVPTWVFQASAYSSWTAEAGYHYDEEETVEVDGRTETRQVQRTRWEDVSGERSGAYAELAVSASKGLKPQEITGLEPFELARAAAVFVGDFLAGFEAETHALTVEDCWPVARRRIESEEEAACARDVPGDTHRSLQVQTTTSDEAFQSALLPVYIAAYDYAGKVFRVLVNGRTGRVEGEAPLSAWKITFFVLALLLAGLALYAFVIEPSVGEKLLARFRG